MNLPPSTHQGDTRATMENAEWHVWNYLDDQGFDTEEISDTGTVDNLLNAGFTLDEICDGEADDRIFDNISWLE